MGIKEDKPGNNKKPFIFYYCIVMLVMMVVNMLLVPTVQQRSVTEVPYSTFLEMIGDGKVSVVKRSEEKLEFGVPTGEKNLRGEEMVT